MNDSRKILAYLIKLDVPPHGLTTCMGCSAQMLTINNHPVEFSNMAAALGSLANIPAKLSITGQGMFTDDAGKDRMARWAAQGSIEKAGIYIDGGLLLTGEFIVPRLYFHGCINGEDVWDIVIESMGGVDVG